MGWLDFRVWLKDRFYCRELLSTKTLGLEEAANMLSSPRIEISNMLFDFKDANQLAGSPPAFVKHYFKLEDTGYDSSVTYSILRSRRDGAVHRLSLEYFLKPEIRPGPESASIHGSLPGQVFFPHNDDQRQGPHSIRRAIIDFYQKEGMHILSREYALRGLALNFL
jgi:hypothetical protein